MEAIELVVKISKEDYERLKEYKKVPFCSLTSRTYEAIAKGIPLPKGHGRLIDADKTVSKICGSSCGCHLEECGHDEPCFSVTRIESAPTIIEADK